MKKKWYKTSEAKQLFIGLAVLLCWSIITGIYSYIKNIDWLKGMSIFWDSINLNVGLGWLIIILLVYTVLVKAYFRRILHSNYLTKKEVFDRLSEKVNCSCCDSSWDVLFSQITPYHPLHELNTAKSYYINRFISMISCGLSHEPSPDYYEVEYGIDGLTNVLNDCQNISDSDRDRILSCLEKCSDKEVGSKKQRLINRIEEIHK